MGCKPKVCWFDSKSGHMPGFQARSPVWARWDATTHWYVSPSLSPSLPLSLKINKIFFRKVYKAFILNPSSHDENLRPNLVIQPLPYKCSSGKTGVISCYVGPTNLIKVLYFLSLKKIYFIFHIQRSLGFSLERKSAQVIDIWPKWLSPKKNNLL